MIISVFCWSRQKYILIVVSFDIYKLLPRHCVGIVHIPLNITKYQNFQLADPDWKLCSEMVFPYLVFMARDDWGSSLARCVAASP